MVNELHWEWRGFGGVTSKFIEHFCSLPTLFEPERVDDLYFWIPDLYINTKFRTGAEDGLKFKRLKQKEGNFEKWMENSDEIFDFPLDPDAWNTLRSTLQDANLELPEYPAEKLNRETTLTYLKEAGCKPVIVKKHRKSCLLQVSGGQVKIEWACISKPQSLISIGLENWTDFDSEPSSEAAEIQDLNEAIDKLELDREPLNIMNYLDAVKLWAEGRKI